MENKKMLFLRNHRFEFILFCVEAVCMILELVASRVLSPYFGNSNLVWTSIIGIILLSGSLGNYLGGKIADKDGIFNKLKSILAFVAIFIFFIPIIQSDVLAWIIKYIKSIKLGAVVGAISLFLIPSGLIGLITPIILKLKLSSLENAGKISGKMYAISTLGGIFGTFLGGFFLIPRIGSIYILYILALIVLLLIPVVDLRVKSKFNILVTVTIIVSMVLMSTFIYTNKIHGDKVLNGELGTYVSYDTQYGRVLIYNSTYNNENVRILNIDSGYESASYTSKEKAYNLVFEYLKYYDLIFNADLNIKKVMMIGGAGYSYPKHYISSYPDKSIDVVEIDGQITEIAKKYFYLDSLIEDYNLKDDNRLGLITEDGRVYINTTTNKYDAILNDAFSGSSPAKTLTTVEAAKKIKDCLNENGVYATNVISSLEGNNSKFIRAEVNTLMHVFKHVYVVPCNDINNLNLVQNNMILCSDSEINLNGVYKLNITENEIMLTDDYCPVDTLVPEI